MWPNVDNENQTDSFADIKALFEGQTETFSSTEFESQIAVNIARIEKYRRWILSSFGLIGGLIAGSQFPFLLEFLSGLKPDFQASNSVVLLGLDVSSLTLWLIISILGLATFLLTTAETA